MNQVQFEGKKGSMISYSQLGPGCVNVFSDIIKTHFNLMLGNIGYKCNIILKSHIVSTAFPLNFHTLEKMIAKRV